MWRPLQDEMCACPSLRNSEMPACTRNRDRTRCWHVRWPPRAGRAPLVDTGAWKCTHDYASFVSYGENILFSPLQKVVLKIPDLLRWRPHPRVPPWCLRRDPAVPAALQPGAPAFPTAAAIDRERHLPWVAQARSLFLCSLLSKPFVVVVVFP